MDYKIVINDEQLRQACEHARDFPYVALDTEFVRTRTYYPQLGLIQLYDGEQLSLIDPLQITEWRPFVELLLDLSVIKFLHASSEDLEVFLHEFKVLPQPLIDTQVLSAFSGGSLSTGFAALVAQYMQVELDKSESRTDWLARPLTDKQLVYAAADVYYLLPLAERLLKETEEKGLLDFALDECRMMGLRRSEIADPERVYQDITNAWQLKPAQLATLKLLAAWRLRCARERDMAINFVVKEENLYQVARYQPTSMGELDKLGLSGQEIRIHGRTLLTLVVESKLIGEEAYPQPVERLVDHVGYKRAFKILKEAIQASAEQAGLSVELMASRRQINQFLKYYWRDDKSNIAFPELMQGWRKQVLGTGLLDVMSQLEQEHSH